MPSNSRSLALLLGLLLFGLSALCDWFSQAPQLAPPLLISAGVSALLCAWGVPQLRRLKDRLARREPALTLGEQRKVDHEDGVLHHDADQ